MKVVLISGLSGSGKSTALKALEDAGYFCVDNLPPRLLPTLLELCRNSSSDISKVAIVMDVRGREFLGDLDAVLEELKAEGFELKVIFLEASEEVLAERFSETRRRHPLEERGLGLLEAIRQEKEVLGFLRDIADETIDTTGLRSVELRQRVLEAVEAEGRLSLRVISFGYSLGIPRDADIVLDVRFLPNPFYVKELQGLSGLDPKVQQYVLSTPEAQEFLLKTVELLQYLLPLYRKEGKTRLTIAIGCTGGRHRSPAVAQRLGEILKESGQDVIITHRDLKELGYGGDSGGHPLRHSG